jgi:hypothetical protein
MISHHSLVLEVEDEAARPQLLLAHLITPTPANLDTTHMSLTYAISFAVIDSFSLSQRPGADKRLTFGP